jgi:hypothetical protein
MSILSIINGITPCKFADIDTSYVQKSNDMITLKYINSKYYIENFNEYSQIKCKLIKNIKIIKAWQKSLNTNFVNSLLFKIKLKDNSCLSTSYYSFVIEIRKNDIDTDEFGLLMMNIFQLIPLGSFNSKLCYLNTFISQF